MEGATLQTPSPSAHRGSVASLDNCRRSTFHRDDLPGMCSETLGNAGLLSRLPTVCEPHTEGYGAARRPRKIARSELSQSPQKLPSASSYLDGCRCGHLHVGCEPSRCVLNKHLRPTKALSNGYPHLGARRADRCRHGRGAAVPSGLGSSLAPSSRRSSPDLTGVSIAD